MKEKEKVIEKWLAKICVRNLHTYGVRPYDTLKIISDYYREVLKEKGNIIIYIPQ